MYLSSFSLVEPQDTFHFYQPSWLNAWEAHLYNRSLAASNANGWGFKRFGMQPERYTGEMIRSPLCQTYLDAMEQSAEEALLALPAKQRMKLLKQRTAFIYVDSWGVSGQFEDLNSILQISAIDTLPKSLVKKFAVNGPTCKMRGENQSFVQAMSVARDYLCWDIFDYVVICAAYRAVPILTFSDEDIPLPRKVRKRRRSENVNLTVERAGCFIFNRQEGEISVSGGRYIMADTIQPSEEAGHILFAGMRPALLQRSAGSLPETHHLVRTYGASGCMTPALSFSWCRQHTANAGVVRTIVPERMLGYSYFDIKKSKE